MSTQFCSAATGELAFVRWAGRRHGVAYEFGTVTNWENVHAALRAGDTFVPDSSSMPDDPTTVEDLERLTVADRVTFGEFPVTVEVGSGELFRFTVEA